MIVIAHRGAPGYLPEHSLAGFAMAHSWDVDYLEPDLVLSKDDVPVVLHDIHIDTTTNVAEIFPKRYRKDGRYYAIDFKLKELKRLNLKERIDFITKKQVFPKRYQGGLSPWKIPTFKEFLNLLVELNRSRRKNIGIYPEIKSPKFHLEQNKDISKIVLEILNSKKFHSLKEKTILQCFDPIELKRIRSWTKLPFVQLVGKNIWKESDADYEKMLLPKGIKEVAKYAQGIAPHYSLIAKDLHSVKTAASRGVLELAHKNNLFLHVYTHRSDDLPEGLTEKSFLKIFRKIVPVDGIFSDFADRL